jgi:hypothetical protein
MQRVARFDHPEVREVVPSHHCVVRFRQRRPVRERGGEAVADALIEELAFPLERGGAPGRYVATTCLAR